MISSNAFDYINVLDKAADASALRNELIANNIANQDTPGYKRQDVDFEMSVLFWTRLWRTKREVNGYIFVYKLEGDK